MAAIFDDEDVISALPDDVLCHILSFLDTKQSMRTSVISKRWKLVWTSVPNLHFNDDCLNSTCFASFVDRVLSLNTVSHVREFFLHCELVYDRSRVEAWIDATIIRDIEILDVSLHRIWLPSGLFNLIRLSGGFFIRKNLVVLRLRKVALDIPNTVYFPSVKIIEISDHAELLDDDCLKNLLSGCPVLEELNISRASLDNARTLYICSSTLKYLLLTLINSDAANEDDGYMVEIEEAPRLCELRLTDFLVRNTYHLGSLSILQRAYLDFKIFSPIEDVEVLLDAIIIDRILELLRKISHIEYLSLGNGTMSFLDGANFENLPIFNNLTHLAVDIIITGWEILLHLLDCSPNLVTFDFESLLFDHDDCQWHPPHSVPKCLLSSLENIKIETIGDCDAEMEMIKYFLENAMVLKKLLIRDLNSNLETKLEFCRELLRLSRSSSKCKIELL